eukprot:926654_1
MSSESSSILTSQTFSIVYGSLYGSFVIAIIIYALIEFIRIHNEHTKRSNNTQNNANASIQLHVIKNNTMAIETEQKYDPEQEDHASAKPIPHPHDIDQHRYDAILQYIADKKIDLNTCSGKLKFLFSSINRKRAMYLAILIHIFDTATDIGVVLDWHRLSQYEAQGKDHNLEGMDMKGFFYLSIGVLLFYRLVSSMIIFGMTYSVKKTLLQLLDLELFETILINWRLGRDQPCDPQVFIQKLEGIFESAPQAVLQMMYIWKSNSTTDIDYLVVMSLTFSLVSLSSRFSTDDEKLFQTRSAHFHSKCSNREEWECGEYYFYRRIWRILDVTSRICVLCLVWVCIGGWFLSFYMLIEFIVLLLFSYRHNKYEILFQLVGIMIVNDLPKSSKLFFPVYRYIVHLILLIVCTYFATKDVCVPYLPDCPTYEFRHSLIFGPAFGVVTYIYCWGSTVLSAILLWVIFEDTLPSKTVERDFASIIISSDTNKYEELITFGLRINFNLKLFNNPLFMNGYCKIILSSIHYKPLLDYVFRKSKLRTHSTYMPLLLYALFECIHDVANNYGTKTQLRWDDIMCYLVQIDIVPGTLIQTFADDTSSLSTFCSILFATSHFKSLLDLLFKTPDVGKSPIQNPDSLMSLLIPALFDCVSDQTKPKWDEIMYHLLQMDIVPIPLIQNLVP